MRKSARTLLTILLLILTPAMAGTGAGPGTGSNIGTEAFSGNWQSTGGTDIHFIRIAPGGGNTLLLRIYGTCHPNICLWGAVTARPDDPATPPDKVTKVSATLNFAYARRTITLQLRRRQIAFRAHYHFSLRAGADKTESGILTPSLWPAPWKKASWELRDGAHTGWGGGPRGGSLVPAKEVCQSFDMGKAVLTREGKSWRARAGNVPLFTTRWPEAKARDALAQLSHFGVNAKCQSGGITYWQKSGNVPRYQPHVTRACMAFSPTTAHLIRRGKDWLVADGNKDIFNLHGSRDNAYALLSMIRHHRLSHKCVFAWPNPILIWWLR